MATIEIVQLVCPECAADLMGPPLGPIFGCPRCRKSFSMIARPPRLIDTVYVQPGHGGPAEPVYMPFWRVAIEPSFVVRSEEKRKRLEQRVPRIEQIFVWGWHIANALYFGDPLDELNKVDEAPDLTPDPDPRGFLAGASIAPVEAVKLARFLCLKLVDRYEDITGVDVRIKPRKLTLVAIPFFLEGDAIISGLSGNAYRREIATDYLLIQRT